MVDVEKTAIAKWDGDRREGYVREKFWQKIKKYAARIPFAHDAVAMYYCMVDPDTPDWVRFTVAGTLAYFILPFDLIPDFIPIGGFSDDASAIAAALGAVKAHMKPEHFRKAEEFFRN